MLIIVFEIFLRLRSLYVPIAFKPLLSATIFQRSANLQVLKKFFWTLQIRGKSPIFKHFCY